MFANCVTRGALTFYASCVVCAAMKTASELIDELGGSTALAAALELPSTTVASWKSRGVIPPPYWTDIIHRARNMGVDAVTLEFLAELAIARPRERAAS